MKLYLMQAIILLLISTIVYGGVARSGIITYIQPDGTTFQGILKGTSTFNWIESNGKIVKYNPADKLYHIAIFDSNNSLVLTDRVPVTSLKNASSRVSEASSHSVSSQTSQKLLELYKKKSMKFAPQ